LWTLNIVSGDKKEVITNAVNGVWSPDGKKIVYVKVEAENIYSLSMCDAGGENENILFKKTEDGKDNYEVLPSWSPDGKSIAFMILGDNESNKVCIPKIFNLDTQKDIWLPVSAWQLFAVGKYYQDQKDINKAMEFWGKLVSEYPDSKEAGESQIQIGNYELKQGNLSKAKDEFMKVLESAPEGVLLSKAQFGLGKYYIHTNDYARGVDLLLKSLENADTELNTDISEFITSLGSPAVEKLIKTMDNPNSYIRSTTATLLGDIGDKSAVPSLLTALSSDDFDLRKNASISLGKIGDTQAVPKLIELLKDNEGEIVHSAIVALGNIGDKSAIEPLKQLLKSDIEFYDTNKSKNVPIYYSVEKALLKIYGKNNMKVDF
jgi:tetratricopeptide (TPR) repeat protein